MATECVQLAKDAHDPSNKAILLQMARSWTNLAERASGAERAEGSSEGIDFN
jgi:hypothetical protein